AARRPGRRARPARGPRADAPAGPELPQRPPPGPRQGLPVPARLPGGLGGAGVPPARGGRPHVLRAHRPRPRGGDRGAVAHGASVELERVDTLLGTAESISTTVDSASRLAYLTFSSPVIKALAFGAGTSRAVRRFRRDQGPE